MLRYLFETVCHGVILVKIARLSHTQRFSEIAVMSSHGAAVNRYLAYDKFTSYTMPAISTIW